MRHTQGDGVGGEAVTFHTSLPQNTGSIQIWAENVRQVCMWRALCHEQVPVLDSLKEIGWHV